jgi:hypothetical protein
MVLLPSFSRQCDTAQTEGERYAERTARRAAGQIDTERLRDETVMRISSTAKLVEADTDSGRLLAMLGRPGSHGM